MTNEHQPEALQSCDTARATVPTAATPEATMADRIRALLREDLAAYVSIDKVADRLSLSRRQVQRLLTAEETSYQKILDDERCNLAKRLLARKVPLPAIAESLVYSDVTGFHRAFRRWTRTTPATYRDLEFRVANARDLPVLLDLQAECYRRDLWDEPCQLSALLGDSIVGLVEGQIVAAAYVRAAARELYSVEVRPRYRRCGVGRSVAGRALAHHGGSGWWARAVSPAGDRLLASLGFVIDGGRHDGLEPESGVVRVLATTRLRPVPVDGPPGDAGFDPHRLRR